MSESLKFSESKQKLTIEILPSIKPIVKFGLIFQGLLITIVSIVLGFVIFSNLSNIGIVSLAFVACCFFLFIIGRKYLRRVFYKEIIEVTKNELTIIDKYLTAKDSESFMISEISNICFAGQHNFTSHFLDNGTVDFSGLSITERETQLLIEDGTIELLSNDKKRRFGKNIASWDAEKIISRIEIYIGRNLHSDNTKEDRQGKKSI